MNTEIAENNPSKRRKNLYTWLFLGWVVLSVMWILRGPELCLPSYRANSDELINYSELIQRHTWNIVNNSRFMPLAVALLVGGGLVYRAQRRWLGLLLIPVICFGCTASLGGIICDQTALDHVATIEFDGSVYHLTLGHDVAGGMDISSDILFLYECDDNGESCRGREIARHVGFPFTESNLRLLVDETLNQLQVINRDEVIYTLDPE